MDRPRALLGRVSIEDRRVRPVFALRSPDDLRTYALNQRCAYRQRDILSHRYEDVFERLKAAAVKPVVAHVINHSTSIGKVVIPL